MSTTTAPVNVVEVIDQQKLSRFQILVAGLCALVVASDGFDAQAIGYVAPSLSKTWALAPGALGPVFGAGVFGMMLGALIFGPIADRLGRKPVIILCLLVFGICSLLTVTADSMTSLFVWRLLTGLGLGGAYPNAIALTCEYSPRRKRATMIMVMFVGFGLGSAIGGAVAAKLTAAYGWTAIFWVGGILPLALVPVLLFALPESISYLALNGTRDHQVAALLRRINSALVFDRATRFVAGEERTTGSTVRHLFHEQRAWGTAMLWIMFGAGLFQLYFLTHWLPTVTHESGIPLEKAVLITAGMQIAVAISTVLFGLLIDRFGPFRVLPFTYLLAAIFVASVGMAGSSTVAVAAAVFGAGFFVGGSQNAANALCAMYYPTAMRSTGISWGHGVGRIGSILGALAGGVMLSRQWQIPNIFLAAAVPMLCACAAAFIMAHVERRKTREAG